jgi:hypothetical protein
MYIAYNGIGFFTSNAHVMPSALVVSTAFIVTQIYTAAKNTLFQHSFLFKSKFIRLLFRQQNLLPWVFIPEYVSSCKPIIGNNFQESVSLGP